MAKRGRYVLVRDDQVTITPDEAFQKVKSEGMTTAANLYGVSGQTLRRFLSDAGYRAQRETTWVREEAPSATPDVQLAG